MHHPVQHVSDCAIPSSFRRYETRETLAVLAGGDDNENDVHTGGLLLRLAPMTRTTDFRISNGIFCNDVLISHGRSFTILSIILASCAHFDISWGLHFSWTLQIKRPNPFLTLLTYIYNKKESKKKSRPTYILKRFEIFRQF